MSTTEMPRPNWASNEKDIAVTPAMAPAAAPLNDANAVDGTLLLHDGRLSFEVRAGTTKSAVSQAGHLGIFKLGIPTSYSEPRWSTPKLRKEGMRLSSY